MSADVTMIGEVPIFALLDDEERDALAHMMDTRDFKQGETMFEYGDSGTDLFIVRNGRVEIFIESTEGEKIVLGEHQQGDVVGELSFLDGGSRTATAIAIEDTQTLCMDRDRLLDFIDKHPHAAIDLLTVVGRRLRATNELLRTQVSRNPNVEEAEMLTFGQRIADKVATFGGSWSFIILFGIAMAVWVVMNSTALFLKKYFDPYPYILLNLFLSMIAALQAPVIMMSQNRQVAKDRLKSDLDYEVNLKAELEVAHLHHKLDHIYERIDARLARMEGRNHNNDSDPSPLK
ncbi:MAG: cyclic nucleotide-binding protein [Candidatus Angelobacter sp. Gp1-AA117]|nr:MAG: cyclic nucleotide-binding protein [Candidatus Angelobacter sp. Gp1-AA117]